jgi:hypothetical protein
VINHLVPHPTVVQWHNIYKDVCGKSESPLLLTLLQRLCVTRATAKQDKHTATEGRGGRGTRHSQAGPSEVKLTFSLLINQREVKQAHFAINKRLKCLDELLTRPIDRRGRAHPGPKVLGVVCCGKLQAVDNVACPVGEGGAGPTWHDRRVGVGGSRGKSSRETGPSEGQCK